MKKLLILFVAIPLFCFPQEPRKSKIEEAFKRANIFLKKEFILVDNLNACKFEVIKLTDISNGSVVSGLKISFRQKSFGSVISHIGCIDPEELPELIKSFEYIKSNVLNTRPETYTEYNYSSSGSLLAGCYWSNIDGWKIFIKLKEYESNSNFYFKKSEVDQLIGILNKANTMLVGFKTKS